MPLLVDVARAPPSGHGGLYTLETREGVQGVSVAVLQLKVVRQVKNPSCGYYALHNSLLCCERAAGGPSAPCGLQDFLDSHAYHRRFWVLRRMLDQRHGAGAGGGHGYWSPRHLQKGLMERCHMEYLIEQLRTGVHGHTRGSARMYSVPAALAALTASGSYEDATAMNVILDEFWAREGTTVLIMGIVNHWVSVALSRRGDRCEVVLLDSNLGDEFLLGAPRPRLWDVRSRVTRRHIACRHYHQRC